MIYELFCCIIVCMREDEIVTACGAEVLKSSGKTLDYNFSTDTRTIKKGDIYLPLKGASFDGENFIEDAISKGAVGYFTTRNEIVPSAEIVFKVKDTLKTYLELASFYKDKIKPKVVAITGSSGKTTTKEMLYSVLSGKFKMVKTFLNHNNEIGFCQTVFNMAADTEVLIVEMGMRGLGEIELISRYARPDIAIITNAGTSHIGRLGSLENIAKAKCEIAEFLPENGLFIALNQNRIKNIVKFKGEKIYFSINDVEILEKKPSYSKFIYKNKEYELNVEGDYNVENALAVIEAAQSLGVSYQKIREGLFAYKPIEKRWQIMNAGGYRIINDSYNANPDSMKAAVKTFMELYENPVAVLGDMGELGKSEVELHREVGRYLAQQKNVKNVKFLTVGQLAAEIGSELKKADVFVEKFDDNIGVSRYILANLDVSNTIFLKASRALKFEEIIENIKRGKL